MEKSEKSFYVIIENKRCGKFSGMTPIQVAKKVASKKLKTSKKTEIIFYLDEVGGKKKRYGPYQMRKDKKTNKITVSVIKKMNIMKGGVLTDDIKIILKKFFDDNRFAEKNPTNVMRAMYNKASTLQFKYFYNEPIVFFLSFVSGSTLDRHLYKYAVFKESNGSIYIMFYTEFTEPTKFTRSITSTRPDFKIISFTDFFLNTEYNIYFTTNLENYAWLTDCKLNKREILEFLKNENNVPSRIICAEAERIYDFLYKPVFYPQNSEKVIIYIPDYSHPLIRKCVYLNLTFGILDEENTGIIPSTSFIQEPTSNLQKFLIMKQSLVGGFSEPIIYFRVPSESNPQSIFFTHCIFTESRTSKNLKIAIYNNDSITINNFNDLSLNNYLYYILLQIPRQMGTLERVRMIANSKINPEQLRIELKSALKSQLVFQGRLSNQRQLEQVEQHLPFVRPQLNGRQHQSHNLPSRLNSVLTKFPQNQKQLNQGKLQELINEIKELIELSIQLEQQQPQPKLNNYAHKAANQGIKLKQQLNNLQTQLQQLQISRFNQKSQPLNLQQQLDQLQKVLTEKLRQQQQQPKLTQQEIKNIQNSLKNVEKTLHNITTQRQNFSLSNI